MRRMICLNIRSDGDERIWRVTVFDEDQVGGIDRLVIGDVRARCELVQNAVWPEAACAAELDGEGKDERCAGQSADRGLSAR